jgi:hypothetical protein
MPTLPDDSWPTGDPALASFVEDLRILAGGPAPEPGPGLVAVMRRGVSDPSPTSPGRRKMLVKTLVGSLAAKVALGLGVAAAGMTAAGAAGVLPDAAQHAVASVVGATTPFAVPDPSTAHAAEKGSVASDDATDDSGDAPGTVTTLGNTGTTLPGTVTTLVGSGSGTGTGMDATADNHGACVSAAAQDKSGSGSHGKTVSSVARSDCGKASGTPTTVVTPSSTTVPTSSTTSTTSVGSRARQNGAGTAGSGAGGNGNGNSGGNSSKATSDSPGKSGKN